MVRGVEQEAVVLGAVCCVVVKFVMFSRGCWLGW